MPAASPAEEARLARLYPALRRIGDAFRGQRIPLVQQVMATDCGAACLAMTLAYLGRDVPLEEVRTAMAVGRDGTGARTLLDTATFYGLRGRAVRVDLADLPHLPPGSILHWNFSHFVVLDRADGTGGVRIVDPAFGPRVVPRDEAARAFTGVAVVLERGEAFVPRKSGRRPVLDQLRIAVASSSDWPRIAVVSVLLQVLALGLPMVQGRLIDRVIPRDDTHLLLVLVAGLAAILVFQFVGAVTRAQLLLQLRTQFDARMTFGFVDHLLRLPYAFFERRQVGDLQTRIGTVSNIREALTGVVLSGLIDGVMVLGHLAFLLLMSVQVTLLALGIVAVQASVYLFTRKKLRELASGSVAKQAEAANALNELLSGIESLKASGCEHRASQTWAARYVDLMNIGVRQGSLSTFGNAVLGTLQTLGPMVLLIGGVLEVMNREMTLGAMMSANALAVGFLQPTMSLVSTLQTLQTVRAQLARIDDVREAEPEQAPGVARLAPRLRGAIALDRVSFSYGPRLRPAVRDVSVAIAPGEWVAIVGRSGSGKTTLGRLLLGLYEPGGGDVRLDGVPLGQLDLGSVRRQLGVVVQRPHIFGTSIRGNIALANPDLPLERVQQAAVRACIHDDIARMPMQYDTPVVAGGTSLSGGQRQRLALARALADEPAIVLLDEATSALDALTEAAVQEQLAVLRCTRVVIAHRLSTVIGADRILVMEDGALVEQGRHDELLARGGPYAQLVMAQLGGDRPLLPRATPRTVVGRALPAAAIEGRGGPATVQIDPRAMRRLLAAASTDGELAGATVRMDTRPAGGRT